MCVFVLVSANFGATCLAQDELTEYEKCRLVTAADLTDAKAPSFHEYLAAKRGDAPAYKLDLSSNPIAKRYRTVLHLDVERGPNFAGHYRAVIGGCGSSCTMFAVVNLKSGRVITPKGFGSVSGVFVYADDFLSKTESDSWGFRYRSNSKLLVVVGDLAEDESREGAFYLVLEGEKLRPLYSTRVDKDREARRSKKPG